MVSCWMHYLNFILQLYAMLCIIIVMYCFMLDYVCITFLKCCRLSNSDSLKYRGLVFMPWISIFLIVAKLHIFCWFLYPWLNQMRFSKHVFLLYILYLPSILLKQCFVMQLRFASYNPHLSAFQWWRLQVFITTPNPSISHRMFVCISITPKISCDFENKTSLNILNPLWPNRSWILYFNDIIDNRAVRNWHIVGFLHFTNRFIYGRINMSSARRNSWWNIYLEYFMWLILFDDFI